MGVPTLLRAALALLLAFQVLQVTAHRGRTSRTSRPPHIVIILADDLGWNDVGFHGSNQIPTPNIDALAYSGVILNNYHVMPVCTPSRAALMTGRHPIHTGMQHSVIFGNEPWGLGLEERLLPEHLRAQGYATHLVGKWHLGQFRANYTPTHRGFDSHLGYWGGHQDYYFHDSQDSLRYQGFDMRRGMTPIWREMAGRYSTRIFTEEAVRLVMSHPVERPLFLYLSHLAVHSANPGLPLQAPPEVVAKFSHIKDKKRRIFAAMLTELDRSVGEVVAALGVRGMLDNSVIVFSTDNGGAAGGFNLNAASNWPLRGTKDTVWEGGVRGAACLWSPLVRGSPRVSRQLAHIQDWLPTLLSAANVSLTKQEVARLDGKDLWSALTDPAAPPTYRELLLHVDAARNVSAIRRDQWKLILGTTWNGAWDHAAGPAGREGEYEVRAVRNSPAARALARTRRPLPGDRALLALRERATVTCDQEDPSRLCHPLRGEPCLFDLEADPCEARNLAQAHPAEVAALRAALTRHTASMVAPRNRPADLTSNPKFWDYQWTNWRDFPLPPALRPLHRLAANKMAAWNKELAN